MSEGNKLSRRKAVGLGLSGALAAAAGGIFGHNILARPRPKNVVFVVADALRADRLGCYGYSRRIGPAVESLTPNIDRIADEGLVFERCLAASSSTLPSVAAFMASRLPFVEGAYYNEGFIPQGALTCAQALAAMGWQTIAVVRNPYLCVRDSEGRRDYAAARGFSRYLVGPVNLVDNPLHAQGVGPPQVFKGFTGAKEVSEQALGVLRQLARSRYPFFLYVHYMDTHEPYDPPEKYKEELAGAPPVEGIPDYLLYQAIRSKARRRGDETLAPEDMPLLERARECYDASVRCLDEWVGALAAYLKVNGLWETTLLVISSDHGEEFAEHGWIGHARTLYDEVLHVPLVCAGRGVAGGARVSAQVSSIDIAPTILSSCEIAVPGTMSGRSLDLAGPSKDSPLRSAAALVRPSVPAAISEKKYSVTDPRGKKLILSEFVAEKEGTPARHELYDLRTDRGEQRDLVASDPAAAAILDRHLESLRRRAGGGEDKAFTVDEETRLPLETLR